MDDWKERLVAMDGRLVDWNRRYASELAALRKQRRGLFRRLSSADEEELAARARRATGEGFLAELFAFLDALCGHYLEEPLPQERAKLRAHVGALPGMLTANWIYAGQSADLVRQDSEGRRMLLALAALSIDDLRTDARAVDRVLGRVWLAARQADLDPAAAFRKVAALSNPGTGGGGAFFSQHLEGFERSLHFRKHVAPALRAAGRR